MILADLIDKWVEDKFKRLLYRNCMGGGHYLFVCRRCKYRIFITDSRLETVIICEAKRIGLPAYHLHASQPDFFLRLEEAIFNCNKHIPDVANYYDTY